MTALKTARRILLISTCALASTLAATPALADQLIENVDGIRIDEAGEIDRFTAILIDDGGRVKAVYDRNDKRPREVDDPGLVVDGQEGAGTHSGAPSGGGVSSRLRMVPT